MSGEVPLVDYLVLGDEPHLVAHECTRAAPASSTAATPAPAAAAPSFATAAVATEGEVRAFTIVVVRRARRRRCRSWPRVVDCDGTSVRGNLVNVEPDPEHVHLGMKVQLVTTSVGTDGAGTEAIGFGFEPVD